MSDIKIREGSLHVRMLGQNISDSNHQAGQAVHIQFQDVDAKPTGNYTFVNGKLVSKVTQDIPFNFSQDTEDWGLEEGS